MEWPKRARTVNWESGVLTLDGEKQFEVPEHERVPQASCHTQTAPLGKHTHGKTGCQRDGPES